MLCSASALFRIGCSSSRRREAPERRTDERPKNDSFVPNLKLFSMHHLCDGGVNLMLESIVSGVLFSCSFEGRREIRRGRYEHKENTRDHTFFIWNYPDSPMLSYVAHSDNFAQSYYAHSIARQELVFASSFSVSELTRRGLGSALTTIKSTVS